MTTQTSTTQAKRIDPRGARFGAGVTSLVLLVILILAPSVAALAVLGWQVLVFAIGAIRGPASGPYSLLYRKVVRPRIGPPSETEDAAPPRFAQGVGLVFAAVGLLGFLLGADVVGVVAVAFALVAALLNAVFGLCLGCKVYVLGLRVIRSRTA